LNIQVALGAFSLQKHKKHQRANSRYIQAQKQLVQGKELTGGSDKILSNKAKLFLNRFRGENLIDRLITNAIIHTTVACIWLVFLWVAVKIVMRSPQ
jgi:hypothetical protein